MGGAKAHKEAFQGDGDVRCAHRGKVSWAYTLVRTYFLYLEYVPFLCIWTPKQWFN